MRRRRRGRQKTSGRNKVERPADNRPIFKAHAPHCPGFARLIHQINAKRCDEVADAPREAIPGTIRCLIFRHSFAALPQHRAERLCLSGFGYHQSMRGCASHSVAIQPRSSEIFIEPNVATNIFAPLERDVLSPINGLERNKETRGAIKHVVPGHLRQLPACLNLLKRLDAPKRNPAPLGAKYVTHKWVQENQ